jgi:hypothetical protein
LDYTSIPKSRVDNPPAPHHSWNNRPKQSTSLSELLKDAPSFSKSSTATAGDPIDDQKQSNEIPLPTSTPPMEMTSPVAALMMSHGGDTPNSMAVERATEPSLRSYSPTSSIRAPSDADYTESPPALNFAHHHIASEPLQQQFHPYPTMESPMAESVATLVPTDSPKSMSAAETSITKIDTFDAPAMKGNNSGDDYVVASSTVPEATGGGLGSSVVDISGLSEKNEAPANPPVVAGKAFLGKGKIDPKAQDDFIAFMLGKK